MGRSLSTLGWVLDLDMETAPEPETRVTDEADKYMQADFFCLIICHRILTRERDYIFHETD